MNPKFVPKLTKSLAETEPSVLVNRAEMILVAQSIEKRSVWTEEKVEGQENGFEFSLCPRFSRARAVFRLSKAPDAHPSQLRLITS